MPLNRIMDIGVTVKILFFAKARELAGCSECKETISASILCADLFDRICEAHNLNIIKESIIIALNGDYCDEPGALLTLKEGDELAVIPPISGG